MFNMGGNLCLIWGVNLCPNFFFERSTFFTVDYPFALTNLLHIKNKINQKNRL